MNALPHLDPETFAFLKEILTKSTCYLEYGCGGSTIYASNSPNIKALFSVDTDSQWIATVKREMSNSACDCWLSHVDLGPVKEWGTPTSTALWAKFSQYSTTPWLVARSKKSIPDVVLIDGRFRVSCFLYTLIAARIGTTVIFDDYFGRPHYHSVEKYCSITQRCGRSAIFRVSKDFDYGGLVADYAFFLHNFLAEIEWS